MDKWIHLRISVSYKEDNRIDFVSRRDKALPSIATHDGMEAYFNVTRAEWEAYLQKLQDDGWELDEVNTRKEGREESYIFRRKSNKDS